MTKKAVKLLVLLLAALLGFYVAYQVYMILYPPYKTEIALSQTISDSVIVDGIVVRNELVIENSHDGIVNYLAQDGDKVAAGASVAQVFSTAQSAANALRIEILQDSLDVLSKAANLGRTSGSNLSYIVAQISEKTSEYSGRISADDLSGLAGYKDELTELLNSYELASGGQIDFSGAIASLESSIASCKAEDYQPSATIQTPETGYFISSVDGFESRINTENVYEMSVEELGKLLAEAQENTRLDETHCKVVAEYTWLYAAMVPKKSVDKFTVGGRYSIDFNYAQVADVPVTVKQINYNDADDYGVVVFECPYLNASIAKLRCEQATVSFMEYDGIKISRSALRLVDGEQGVYIKYGSTVAFRKVDKLFETDDYIISRPGTADGEYLALYDEIIVEGKDLYEGKELGN